MKIICPNCGSTELYQNVDGTFSCGACTHRFSEDLGNNEMAVAEALDATKNELLANARSALYEAVNRQNIDDKEIIKWCDKINSYIQDDFLAHFYYAALSDNENDAAEFIDGIGEEYYDYADIVLDFMLKVGSYGTILPMKCLADRVFISSDDGDLKTKYFTKIEELAEKLQDGTYFTSLNRDVFVAYSSKDFADVNKHVAMLEENGITCFVAMRNLRHGKNAKSIYLDELKTAMRHCKSLVFFASKHSRNMQCDALKQELPYWKDNEKGKLSVIYNLDEVPCRMPAVNMILKQVFPGQEYCRTDEDLIERLLSVVTGFDEPKQEEDDHKYCVKCLSKVPLGVTVCPHCQSTEFRTDKSSAKARYDELQNVTTQNATIDIEEIKSQSIAEYQNKPSPNAIATTPIPQSKPHIEPQKTATENDIDIEELKDQTAAEDSESDSTIQSSFTNEPQSNQKLADILDLLKQGNAYYNNKLYGLAFECLKILLSSDLAEKNEDLQNAQYTLGLMYKNGQGVEQSDKDAAYWYEKAAKQGLAEAQCNLGIMYDNGQGVAQNYKDAVYWFEKAAGQEYARAQYDLGVAYENGQGVAQNYKYAVYWYEKAAEQGCASAQSKLAYMYDKGQGVEQSYTEAVKWYKKAAEQGCASAQSKLAYMYDKGQGVKQSDKDAIYWYKKAAEQGNEDTLKLTLIEKMTALIKFCLNELYINEPGYWIDYGLFHRKWYYTHNIKKANMLINKKYLDSVKSRLGICNDKSLFKNFELAEWEKLFNNKPCDIERFIIDYVIKYMNDKKNLALLENFHYNHYASIHVGDGGDALLGCSNGDNLDNMYSVLRSAKNAWDSFREAYNILTKNINYISDIWECKH